MGFFDTTQQSTQQTAQTANQNSQQNPWSAQIPYLLQAFGGASGALNQANTAPQPTNFVAGLTPQQQSLYQQMYGTGSGTAPGLTGAGTGALTGALGGLGSYSPTSFSSIINNAGSAASNPYLSGMVTAANTDAVHAAQEAERQNNQTSAATGNINSSRAGAADAIIASRLGETVANNAANIYGNAWNNGLGIANSNAATSDAARLAALNSGVSGGNTALSGGTGLFGLADTGATNLQAGNQANLANQLQQWQFGTQAPFAGLSNFMNIIGGQNWGGTTNTTGTQYGSTQGTQTKSPSGMDITTGLLGAAKSLFG